jgi:hypothetical protein
MIKIVSVEARLGGRAIPAFPPAVSYQGFKKRLSRLYNWESYIRRCLRVFKYRLLAARDSLCFQPGEFSDQAFVRFTAYQELKRWLPERFPLDGPSPRIVEFGGSNHVIKSLVPNANYEVAPNWPDVDVQSLAGYPDESYDAVVLDHILEHVRDPFKAVAEVRRILKLGGVCIATTPFLIRIHCCSSERWSDYWRFTGDGLRTLFRDFSAVDVFSWGNRVTLNSTLWSGWQDCKRTKRWLRAALWNEEDWPVGYLTRAHK